MKRILNNILNEYLIDDDNVEIIIFFSSSISFDKKIVVSSAKFAHGRISLSTDDLFFNEQIQFIYLCNFYHIL